MKITSRIFFANIFAFALLFLTLGLVSAQNVFTEPSADFPNGNPAAPLDTSNQKQQKIGPLRIGGDPGDPIKGTSILLQRESLDLVQDGDTNKNLSILNFPDPAFISRGLLNFDVKGLRLPNLLTSDVLNPKAGTIIFDKNSNTLQLHDGTKWGGITGGGGSTPNDGIWKFASGVISPASPSAKSVTIEGNVSATNNAKQAWIYVAMRSTQQHPIDPYMQLNDPRYAVTPDCACHTNSSNKDAITCDIQNGFAVTGDTGTAPQYCKDPYNIQVAGSPPNMGAVIFVKNVVNSFGGWLTGQSGYGDQIGIGGDISGDDLEINIAAPEARNKISFWNEQLDKPANVYLGTINAQKYLLNGRDLVTGGGGGSQWSDVTGGIAFKDGNVGIGTDNPSGLLSVMGAGSVKLGGEGNSFVPLEVRGNVSVESRSGTDYEYERGSRTYADNPLARKIQYNQAPSVSSWPSEWSQKRLSCDGSLVYEGANGDCLQPYVPYPDGGNSPDQKYDLFIGVDAPVGVQCAGVPPQGTNDSRCVYFTAARLYNKTKLTGGGVFARYAGIGTGALDVSSLDPEFRITTQGGGVKIDAGSAPALVTKTGNVGLGNSAPKELLHVGPKFTIKPYRYDGKDEVQLGFNVYHDGKNRSIGTGDVAAITFTEAGEIKFKSTDGKGAGDEIADWREPLIIGNNGVVRFRASDPTKWERNESNLVTFDPGPGFPKSHIGYGKEGNWYINAAYPGGTETDNNGTRYIGGKVVLQDGSPAGAVSIGSSDPTPYSKLFVNGRSMFNGRIAVAIDGSRKASFWTGWGWLPHGTKINAESAGRGSGHANTKASAEVIDGKLIVSGTFADGDKFTQEFNGNDVIRYTCRGNQCGHPNWNERIEFGIFRREVDDLWDAGYIDALHYNVLRLRTYNCNRGDDKCAIDEKDFPAGQSF